MEILLEDYKRRLETALDILGNTKDNGGVNDTKKMERIRTKISCYRTFIAELEREMANAEQSESNFAIPVVSVAKRPLPRPLEAWRKANKVGLQEYIDWSLEQEKRGNAR